MNVEVQGPDVSGFPLAFLTSFFANMNQRASIDMKHVRRSDRRLPRKTPCPTSLELWFPSPILCEGTIPNDG